MKQRRGPVRDWCRREFPQQADAAYALLRQAQVSADELRQYGYGWRQYIVLKLAGQGAATRPDHDYSPRRKQP